MKKIYYYFFDSSLRKKMGEGWDYVVFENSKFPGKVIKVLRPYPRQLLSRIFTPKRFSQLLKNKHARQIHMLNTKKSLKNILERNPEILGNPRFIGTTYIQDKVTTLRDFLKKHPEKKPEIFEKFFRLLQTCWTLGFSDKYFKYSTFGVTKEEKVILIDLSELTFSKNEIKRIIKIKRWLYSFDSLNLGTKIKQSPLPIIKPS